MGFKQTDLVPIAPYGPTALTPASKDIQMLVFQTTRSDTVATVKQVVPADASITLIRFYPGVASNAATTAAVTVTISDNSGVISTGTFDVKTNGATGGVVAMSNLPNLESLPLNGDLKISAVYAETGTASTLGGPWRVGIQYVR